MTGEQLGSRGQAIRVDIPYELPAKPNLWQRWLPRYFPTEPNKITFTVLVCCPACVAEAKADPSKYYLKVYSDRLGLSPPGMQRQVAPAAAGDLPPQPSCPSSSAGSP